MLRSFASNIFAFFLEGDTIVSFFSWDHGENLIKESVDPVRFC